jgi:hypothetical protein
MIGGSICGDWAMGRATEVTPNVIFWLFSRLFCRLSSSDQHYFVARSAGTISGSRCVYRRGFAAHAGQGTDMDGDAT